LGLLAAAKTKKAKKRTLYACARRSFFSLGGSLSPPLSAVTFSVKADLCSAPEGLLARAAGTQGLLAHSALSEFGVF